MTSTFHQFYPAVIKSMLLATLAVFRTFHQFYPAVIKYILSRPVENKRKDDFLWITKKIYAQL